MKAIIYENFGGVEKLKLKELPDPHPDANEVLIEMHAAGVNPVDWKIREGYLKSRIQIQFPVIPGWDAAGVIKAVGTDVKGFKIGDNVYTYCRKPVVQWGTYAEFVAVNENDVAPKP